MACLEPVLLLLAKKKSIATCIEILPPDPAAVLELFLVGRINRAYRAAFKNATL